MLVTSNRIVSATQTHTHTCLLHTKTLLLANSLALMAACMRLCAYVCVRAIIRLTHVCACSTGCVPKSTICLLRFPFSCHLFFTLSSAFALLFLMIQHSHAYSNFSNKKAHGKADVGIEKGKKSTKWKRKKRKMKTRHISKRNKDARHRFYCKVIGFIFRLVFFVDFTFFMRVSKQRMLTRKPLSSLWSIKSFKISIYWYEMRAKYFRLA